MPRKSANVSLKSFDDIFSTEESRQEEKLEHIQQIPLSELHAFEGHPFRVVDDEEMQKVVDSMHQSWQDLSRYRSSFVRWTMMKPLSAWWMRISRGRISCRVKERGRIG